MEPQENKVPLVLMDVWEPWDNLDNKVFVENQETQDHQD